MKTAVITDSNSGITASQGARWEIEVLPMPVIVDGEVFFEGVNITEEEFYGALTSEREVSTSQPAPGEVVELWERLFKKGYDEIVHIPMSSSLSCSCQSAIGLAKDFDGRVQVVDNHRLSVTQYQSARDARWLAAQGLRAEDIRKRLEAEAYESSIYVMPSTLEYLKRGGRVTPAAAAIGSVLNIKPVLTIQGKSVDSFAKVRGLKKGWEKMIEAVKNDMKTRFAKGSHRLLSIGVAGTCMSRALIEEWKAMVQAAFEEIEVFYLPLSFSLGCHIGPEAVGIGICKSIEPGGQRI